jgi:ADP-heptose:LPS heptosyltransferase
MEIQKALTFRASSIGDCLMGKYLLENIHMQFPQAQLGLVVASRAGMIRDLFDAYSWLEVIEANRRTPRAFFSLLKGFYGSDLVVTQYAGKQGGKFSLASKFVARALVKRGGLVGFIDASRWNSVLYDTLVPVRSDLAVAEHEREALRTAGLPVVLPFPTLQYVKDASALRKYGLMEGKFIVVHLFSGSAARGLYPDIKRKLLAALAQKLPGTRLVISGGTSDREEALRAADGLPVKVIAGEATLQEMMNLIAHSRAVVSVDTGMAHIAAQLGKPLVVVRTCIGRQWWLLGQYGNDAPITVFSRDSVCENGHLAGAYPPCIGAIDIQDIAKKVSTV